MNNFVYFIEKGSCNVTVKDKQKLRNQDKYVRSLKTGDCFGEIALIYKERRSCSVSSTNFTTLGTIDMQSMYELFVKYPELKQIMIEKINEYDDVLKIFFEKTLNSIDFFQGISTEITNELIFSFIPEYHEKDSIIFKQDDIAEKMYIIQNGMIEIYTVMDNGVIFILERLYRGSVINHRSFLLQDSIDICARCATPVSVYYITLDKFAEIRHKSQELHEQVAAIED